MHKFLFYNKFIIFPYMFRALCAHHQEVKLYYTASGIVTLCRWPSGALVQSALSTSTLTLRDLRHPPRCSRRLRSDVMLCWLKLVTLYRSFETTYWSHLQEPNSLQRTLDFLTLEDGTVMSSRTFVNPYQPPPRNIHS